MDISIKLKLIQEGYTLLQVYPELLNYINSYIRSLSVIEQTSDKECIKYEYL